MVGLDALLLGGEPLTLRRALGLIVGFSGIVMLGVAGAASGEKADADFWAA